VRTTRAVAVRYIVFGAGYLNTFCIFVEFGPCVLQKQWLCGIESISVCCTRSVAV
jgi:hypothetical protein